jgi:Fic family protein
MAVVLGAAQGPLVDGKYLHWDKFRFYPPPEGLSHREWWLSLKLQRRGIPVPLKSTSGSPFQFNLANPLPERLREIDLSTGGTIRMPEQVTNSDSRNSYLVRSLIEEAFTSSQLEGAASTREVAKDLIRQQREPRGRGERMILNNYNAMQLILELKDQPLSPELIFEIHREVTVGTLDDPTASGRLRRNDEYRIVGDDFGSVFHEPPPAGQLADRMRDMCDFANDESPERFIHPAIRSMILHFWLAYDHPFVDGNGRTARALFYWSMLRHEYWLFEFISISHVILKSSVAYGRAYLHAESDDNDLTYFLIYHADVVHRAIRELTDYIENRTKELKELEAGLRGLSELNYRQKELISHALRHPGHRYTVESHRASHDVSRQTANNDLNTLARRGLLKKVHAGKEHHFIAVADLTRRLSASD